MAKNSNPVAATEIKYPLPGGSPLKSDPNLGGPKVSGDSNGVAGSGKTGLSPVSSESTSPIRGDGYGNGMYDAPGTGRRTVVTYGKG